VVARFVGVRVQQCDIGSNSMNAFYSSLAYWMNGECLKQMFISQNISVSKYAYASKAWVKLWHHDNTQTSCAKLRIAVSFHKLPLMILSLTVQRYLTYVSTQCNHRANVNVQVFGFFGPSCEFYLYSHRMSGALLSGAAISVAPSLQMTLGYTSYNLT